MSSVERDFVPQTNQEMVTHYRDHVLRVVTRFNRVATNYEDITQHVWMMLFKNRVLEKYEKSAAALGPDVPIIPPTITALEATLLLGVNWKQWRTMMWFGQPAAEKSHAGHFRRHYRVITPIPVSGTWCSKFAVFRTEDVLNLHNIHYFKKRTILEIVWPMATPLKTRSPFRTYLTTAIHNIFANFCRTHARRYKELTQAPAEDGTPWEAALTDGKDSAVSSDVRIAITEAVDGAFSGDPERPVKARLVLTLLGEGHTLTEIAKRLQFGARVVERVRTALGGGFVCV